MAPNSPIPLPHGELDLSTAEVRTTSGTHTLSDREVSLLQGLAKRPGQAIVSQVSCSSFIAPGWGVREAYHKRRMVLI